MEDLEGRSIFTRSIFFRLANTSSCALRILFTCKFRIFPVGFMRLGFMSAPAASQEVINKLFKGLLYASVYVDDILVFSKDLMSYVSGMKTFLRQISEAGFRLKLKKCKFAHSKVQFARHIVS